MVNLFRLLSAAIILIGLTACGTKTSVYDSSYRRSSVPSSLQTSLPLIQFTIQVGAFSTSERAARYAQKLRAIGLDAYYFIDKDGFNKVRFERFPSKSSARSRAATLQAQGVIEVFYIVQPGMAGGINQRTTYIRKNIARTTRRFLGIPYRWGGESPRSGFDCSGLTMTVYRLNGLQLPRNSRAQFDAGRPVSIYDLQVGDLVFFATGRKGRVSHVGVFMGNGQFIHAPRRGKTIRYESMKSSYFKKRFMGARRYL